jgi:hypothetical protein
MGRLTFWMATVLVSLSVVWLVAGRRAALVVDRFITVPAKSLPVSPLEYDGGGLLIGKESMTFCLLNNLRADLQLATDSAHRVVLCIPHGTFTLGPRTNPIDPSGRPQITFVPDPTDEVSFVTRGSPLIWPTPFELHILGGASPWWKRYAYYTLLWKKPSGEKLKMSWRYERQYYAAHGWTTPAMLWNSETGLLSIEIQAKR